MAHNLIFLLSHSALEKDEPALLAAEKTLKQMYRGGIYDHIGGGFSRYSTDEKWLVPHFEKMLYDNALLLHAYAEAYRMTGEALYARVSRGILHYILNVLTDEEGGFYCGQDADSEGVEGKFYTFEKEEIGRVLGEEDAKEFCRWFGISENGNFEGKNILNLIENEEYEKENEKIDGLGQKLYDYRQKRMVLHRDDKILTSWNGLMIAAIAKASRVLGDDRILETAKQSQAFIEKNLTGKEGRLYIRYRDGQALHDGQLDDYAFYAFGLIELYEASFDISYLNRCAGILEKMLELFSDENGGFYMYAHDRDQLISRPKELYDGALPSGNSVAAYVMSRLYHLTGKMRWQQALEKQLAYLAGVISQSPANYCFSLLALQSVLYPSTEIICVSDGKMGFDELKELQKGLSPDFSVLLKIPSNEEELAKAAPYTRDYPIPSSGSKYYVCRNGSCMRPAENMSGLQELLKSL